MNRDILLPTFSDHPEFNADFDYFKVLITPEIAKKCLQRTEMVKALKAFDASCFEISFWDGRGDYFTGDYEEGHDATQTPLSCECAKLVATDTGVYWSCVPKHSEITITTESVSTPQLQILAKED